MISFIGAGPGDPELLTIKGKKLIDAADVIIYAGSLVNPEVLSGRKPTAEVHNSAYMDLDEVIAVMEKAKYITADHVRRAKKRSEPVEEQIKQRYGSYQKGMTHDISDAQKQKSEYYLQNEYTDDSMYQ